MGRQSQETRSWVVYNTLWVARSPKPLQEYYGLKRQIPTESDFRLRSAHQGEDMTREEYRTLLQFPLAKAIKSNQLWHFEPETVPATNQEPAKVRWKLDESKIRYAALCYGVPVRIRPRARLRGGGGGQIAAGRCGATKRRSTVSWRSFP